MNTTYLISQSSFGYLIIVAVAVAAIAALVLFAMLFKDWRAGKLW